MDRLIAMDYMMQITKIMNYKRQGQVTAGDAREVLTLIRMVDSISKKDSDMSSVNISSIQVALICETFLSSEKDVMTNAIKLSLESVVRDCLHALAIEIRRHYETNDFELTREVSRIMRYAVELNYEAGIV